MKLLNVVEDPWHGGRHDDAARVKDIQGALNDAHTTAIVSASGGAYFSRILPHLDFSPLLKRKDPLWVFGFSEMSTLVGQVASYRSGRGVYWLCPNFLSWRIQPPEAARAALAEFWRVLPEMLAGRRPTDAYHLSLGPIAARRVAGKVKSGRIRLVGGCLSVIAATTGSPLAKRVKPDGKWLMLEDIKESPYRIDRHLAALKLGGWFDKVEGLLLGDFHMMHEDTQPAVLDLLKYHLPKTRKVPVVTTRDVGHVWPMSLVVLNRPLEMSVRHDDVTIDGWSG
jgi:muramoyltetrapeptide carboxypeptidase